MSEAAALPRAARSGVAFGILGSISLCHMLNDVMQSLLLAIYPILKQGFDLSFVQIGLITLTYQITASLLQPLVGYLTDRRPQPYTLPMAMGCTLGGLLVLASAGTYPLLLLGAGLLGTGSSIFHPESSRIARAASAGRHGLGQSLFQVGGNFGSSLGPLLAAFVVLPNGRGSLAWFAAAALCGGAILANVARWYDRHRTTRPTAPRRAARAAAPAGHRVGWALAILVVLMMSKYFYLASINSYYIFYLMHHFHLALRISQIYLFVFLAAAAAGVVIGGPIGDRFGRKYVIWGSIFGVLPFTLALPYVGLGWTVALSVVIGLVLSSAFSAIVVYATELVPTRIGLMSGLFFGLAFGIAGIGAAALGALADRSGIDTVYHLCSFLPALGLLAVLLPDLDRQPA